MAVLSTTECTSDKLRVYFARRGRSAAHALRAVRAQRYGKAVAPALGAARRATEKPHLYLIEQTERSHLYLAHGKKNTARLYSYLVQQDQQDAQQTNFTCTQRTVAGLPLIYLSKQETLYKGPTCT